MKFSKVLQQTATELPELNDMFLRYKELKKQLKSIPRRDENAGPEQDPQANAQDANPQQRGDEGKHSSTSKLSSEELKFIGTLNEDLGKFNRFFMEQEEEAVIQLQALTDELAAQQGGATSIQLKERLVQFHGSCVMLMHWSLLNYAAVAKILKKHDKRTGLLLRAPCLTNVLQQPFNNTSVMSRLVKRAEEQLLKVTPPATTAGFGKRVLQQHSQPQQQQCHLISAPPNKQALGSARSPAPAPTAAAAAAVGNPAPADRTPAGVANDPTAPLTGGATAEQPGAHAVGCEPEQQQQQQQPSSSPQQQHHQPPAEPAPLERLIPVSSRSVSVEKEAAEAAAAAAAAVGEGEAAAAEKGAATAVAAAAGGGGMTHHALRALEMWKTLQATASTPSTVVPEGSSQPASLGSGAVQLPPHHHHQLHSHSHDSQLPLPSEDSSRGVKRSRDEADAAHHQQHSCHLQQQQPQNPHSAEGVYVVSTHKKQNREVEQGV